MKVFCLTLLALFPLALMANDDLEKTYAALYELSVSTSESTVGQRGAAKLIEKRNLSFAKVKSERSLQFLFQPFLNLETFFSPAMLQGLARATATPLENPEVVNKELARLKLWLALRPGKMKFHELNAADQAELLQSLLQSKLSVLRRIAKNVRALQLDAAYGAELGFVFSGTPFPKIVNPTPVPKPTFKTHLKYNSATQEMEGALDYIVVGSGASGSIIAAELHRAGKKVVVVERGSLFLNGAFESRLVSDFMDSKTSVDGSVRILTGNAFGGGTAVNGDIVERLTDKLLMKRFMDWKKNGQIPEGVWTKEELLAADAWVAEQLGTRVYTEAELTKTAALMRKGAERLGNGGKVKFYASNTYAPSDSNLRITSKINAADRLLIPAILSPKAPVTILPDAKVTRLLMDSSQTTAIGVEFEAQRVWENPGLVRDPYDFKIPTGTKVKLYAKKVVVCAGPLGTTAILRNSGIQNSNIGRSVIIHPTTMISGVFDKQVAMNEATESPILKVDYRKKDFGSTSGNFLLLAPRILPSTLVQNVTGDAESIFKFVQNYQRVQTIFMGLFEESNPNNRIVVDKNGAPQVEYAMSPRDRERFAYMTAEAAKTLLASGAKFVSVASNEDYKGKGTHAKLGTRYIKTLREAEAIKRNLKVVANQSTILGLHVISGNMMGTSPEKSVVNGNYEVWGTKNLYVADSSVFPGSTGTHPMQSIYVIAKIFSDQQTKVK